jgi:lysophospholipase L1-like esterase
MRALRWGYIVGLHLVLTVLIWRTDAIELVERKLGRWVRPELDRAWYNEVAFHRRIDEQLAPGGLLFIGDSLLRGLDVSRFGRPAANYAIGGDTTAGVLSRLETYRTIATASAVVVLIGVNDHAYRPPESTAGNLGQIVKRIAASTPVVAIGLLPVDERKLGQGRNAVLKQINAELAQACADLRRCRYVDTWPGLAPDGNLAADYHDGDGLHLSRAGYERLAAAIAAALAP